MKAQLILNQSYLLEQIARGTWSEDRSSYKFSTASDTSKTNGLIVTVYKDGTVKTEDVLTGKKVIKRASNEARGYVTVQLFVPWEVENSKKNRQAGTSEFTCYIHQLVALVKEYTSRGYVLTGGFANHMNLNKTDNSFDNIEYIKPIENELHGYMAGLILLHSAHCDVEVVTVVTTSKEYKALKHGFSYFDIEEYVYSLNERQKQSFRENLKARKVDTFQVMDFADFLNKQRREREDI